MIKLVERVDPGTGELLVTGTQPESVDSRIFGPVRRTDLLGKVIWHVAKPQ
jgi:type IV secretory pathway protease TraF